MEHSFGGNATRAGRAWVCMVLMACVGAVTAATSPNDATEQVRQRLEQLAESNQGALTGIDFAAPAVLQGFYQARAFELAWNDKAARALETMIADTPNQGLDAVDYLSPQLQALPDLAALTGTARVDADLLLTEAFLRLAYHHRFGKVDPHSIETTWNYARNVSSGGPFNVLERILGADDFVGQFTQEMGHGRVYEAMCALLARYRGFAANGGWEALPSGPTLRPDALDPRIPALRRRLIAEGYPLAGDAGSANRFDAALADAMRSFQQTHDLNADGVVGKGTFAELNVPVTRRIDQIRVNLERLRWVLVDRAPTFIVVNIAGFRVYYVEDDVAKWTTRAVVGKPYRATPLFRADMKYLVLNPDWTVPPTILRKDVLPAMAKDSRYLAAHQMDVVDKQGHLVDVSGIDWSRYPPAPFPYLIRQRPGPTNSLGRIKFIFPNSYFVFLHDTNARNLFDKPDRSFSSGCIRVEHPEELAEILLRSKPDWSRAAIDAALATGETRTVFLDKPLPVLLMYLTVAAFDGGKTFVFYRDVYKRDAQLLAALDAGFKFVAPAGMPDSGA